MLLPHPVSHLVNGHVLGLGQQEHGKQRHDEDPAREEKEDPGAHMAHHREEGLGDNEGEEHVRADRKEKPGRPRLEGEGLARD